MGRLRLRKLTQVVSVHTNWKIRVPGFCSGWGPVNKSQVPQIPPGLAVEENIGVSSASSAPEQALTDCPADPG